MKAAHLAGPWGGVSVGCLTTAAYMIGAGRVFSFDSAVTFGNFVDTSSWWAVFGGRTSIEHSARSLTGSNDHVLLSVISHLIFLVSGTHSEAVYRFLPAAAGGAAVGLVFVFLVARFGWVAGLGATLFMATDPLWVANARDLRGYSLMVLFTLLATGLLITPASWSRKRLAGYTLLLTAAIASHVLAGMVIVIHGLYVAGRRPGRLPSLIPAWIVAALLGLACNMLAISNDLQLLGHGALGRFDIAAPKTILFFLLGAPSVIAVGLWLTAVVLGAVALRDLRWFRVVVVGIAVMVAIEWLVLQPSWLFARFFMFLVPAAAVLIAAAIRRWPLILAPAVVVGAVFAIAVQLPDYTTDQSALRDAARVIDETSASGRRPCVFDGDSIAMVAYTRRFAIVDTPVELAGCDVVVIPAWNVEHDLMAAAPPRFPHQRVIHSEINTLVLSRDP